MSTHLLLNEQPLQVLPTLAAIFGINEAIAIQQIHWVVTIKHEHQDDRTFYQGFMWCKYTLAQWGKKMPWISGSSIYRIFKNLENDGIIKTCQPFASSRDQTKWYRIDYEVFQVKTQTPFSQNDEIPFSQNDEIPFSQNDEIPFSQNDEIPFSQNDEIPFSQNDEMINIKKDLKDLNKKAKENFLRNSNSFLPEVKTSDHSDSSYPKDPKTPPIAPPAVLSPKNSNKAIAVSKQAERYQQFEERFSQSKPINRYVSKAFIDAGYSEWHHGAHPNDWRKSLIEVCIQRKKKRGDESTVGSATDFIFNVVSECVRLGMWSKFQNLVDKSLELEAQEFKQKALQQQQSEQAPQQLEAIAPVPTNVREFAAKLARRIS